MKIKKVLLFYKESVYANYFIRKGSSLRKHKSRIPRQSIMKLKEVHREHYTAVETVEQTLKELGIKYQKRNRGQKIKYSSYDLIITVGGDGTFMEAARNLTKQYIIGVNSSPQTSVGIFCTADVKSLPEMIKKILTGKARVRHVNRLKIQDDKQFQNVNVLNDILISHRNPAAMSRYHLSIGKLKEDQRSSGIWISTAAGSTGAIRSAGGKSIPISSGHYQYKPRELYYGVGARYKMKGGIVKGAQSIKVRSLMREGMIFVDGARAKWPFAFGKVVKIMPSSSKLKMIVGTK